MSFDPACLDLAEYFLIETPQPNEKIAERLAQRIQDVIEDFMQDGDNFPEPEPRYDTREEHRGEV